LGYSPDEPPGASDQTSAAASDGTGEPTIIASTDNAVTELPVTFAAVTLQGQPWPSGTFIWDFGDDNVAQGPTVSHAYAKAGTYTVTLCFIAAGLQNTTGCSKTIQRQQRVFGPSASETTTPEPNSASPVLTPIARWNVVPHQRLNAGQTLQCGVVAFSKNGVRYVRFATSGGAPVDVESMTFNDQSGVWEYWTPVAADDFETDGQIAIWAMVVGIDGGVRVLEPLTLYVNRNNSRPHVEAWVRTNGHDETAVVGQRDRPFQTLRRAAIAIAAAQNGDASGGRIHLDPGVHAIAPEDMWTWVPCSQEWLEVIGDEGPGNTTIAATGALNNINRLKVSGCTLDRSTGAGFIINSDSRHADLMEVWIHDCVLIGAGQRVHRSEPIGVNPQTRYLTDSMFSHMENPTLKAQFCRGLTIEHIGDDAFANCGFIVNCTAEDLDPYHIRSLTEAVYTPHGHPNGYAFVVEKPGAFANYSWSDRDRFYSGTTWNDDNAPVAGKISDDAIYLTAELAAAAGTIQGSLWTNRHSDCVQWYQGTHDDNAIVYGYRATNYRYQGLFIRGTDNGHRPAPSGGMAFVNVYLEPSPDSFGGNAWYRQVNHLIWWHCTMIGRGMALFRDPAPPDDPWPVIVPHFSCRGNVFHMLLANHQNHEIDWSDCAHNHFIQPNAPPVNYFELMPGVDNSVGDAGLNADGGPRPDSPLKNRLTQRMVPADLRATPRGESATIGAYE